MSSAKLPRASVALPDFSSPLPAFFLRTLLACYYPFIAVVVVLNALAVFGLARLAFHVPILGYVLGLPTALLTLTLLQLLWALRVLFIKIKDHDDEMELRVPREMAPQLYDWVESIANERDLPMPDDIRVSADTVAHVYQRVNGNQVLVFGAIAVRVLPQPVLAGVVAHELGHLGAGDTALGRQSIRRHAIMQQLEIAFHIDRHAFHRYGHDTRSLMTLATMLNPAIWAVRLYHLLYVFARAAHSRQCEFAADRQEVKQSGARSAAKALILLTVADRFPWCRLSSLAQAWVETNQPPRELFEEQERAAKSISPIDWQDAIRKEMKKSTGFFDSHPGLKDRLAALGVSRKQALQLTPGLEGQPSHELFDRWWPKLETQLAERLLAPFRDAHIAKMRTGELVTALDRLRNRARS